jgi:hypothetical protein
VNYNQSLYRTGFRPYGHTDPFAASQLNGLGQYHPFTESGGWPLHGFGQVHPFGPWTLHGMGMLGDIVPDGAIVVYTGTWVPHGMQGATEIIGRVSNILAGEGLSVRSVSSSPYAFLKDNTVNVKLTIQVANGMGYSAPSDVASIVDNAAWQVTGSMPLASSISSVQVPGGPPAPTGQPEIPNTGSGSGEQPPPPPTDFTTWLEQNALWLGLGIGALVLLPKLL